MGVPGNDGRRLSGNSSCAVGVPADSDRSRSCSATPQRVTPRMGHWRARCPRVLLVADELVANAVEHARTVLALQASFDGTAVIVEVRDESNLPPRLQPHDASAVRGRGS